MAKKAAKKTKPRKKPKLSRKAKPRAAAKPKARAKPKAKAEAAKPKSGVSLEKRVQGGTLLGLVEDFFSHVGVIALTLKKPLAAGDTIRVKGHTTDITQRVDSMQIEHATIQSASAGDSVGIKVAGRARKGDAVYKV